MSVSGQASDTRVSTGRNCSPQKRRSLNPGGTLKRPSSSPGGMARRSHDPKFAARGSLDPTTGSLRRSVGSMSSTRRSADLEMRSHDSTRRSPDCHGASHDPGWLLRKPLDSRSPSVNSIDLANVNDSFQLSSSGGAVQGKFGLERAQSSRCGDHGDGEVLEDRGLKMTVEDSGAVGQRDKRGEDATTDKKYTRRSLRKRKPVKALLRLALSSDSNMDSADDSEHALNSRPATRETCSKESSVALISSTSTPSSSTSSLTVGVALNMVESGGVTGAKNAGDVPIVQKRGRGRPRKNQIPVVVGAKTANQKRVQRLKRLGIRSKRRNDLAAAVKKCKFLNTSQTSESSESEMEKTTRKRGRPSYASMLNASDSGSNKNGRDFLPKTKRLRRSSSSSASSPASKKGTKPGVFLGTMLAPLLAGLTDVDIYLPPGYVPYKERMAGKQSTEESQTEPTHSMATRHPEQTSTSVNHPLEKLVSANSCTVSNNSAENGSNQLGSGGTEERASPSKDEPVAANKRLNLRNTADRRSRANCSSNNPSNSSTPSILSPQLANKDDPLPDKCLAPSSDMDYRRDNVNDESMSPNVDPKDGNRKSRRFGSKSKEAAGGNGDGSVSNSQRLSQHFKFLMSLESDCGRGSNSTRGSMLYAHENCPEKLTADEPWINRARYIWSLWRTKVPLEVRNDYIERAKENKKKLAEAASIPSPDKQAARQMRKNTARKLSAFTPMTSRLKEASPIQFDAYSNTTATTAISPNLINSNFSGVCKVTTGNSSHRGSSLDRNNLEHSLHEDSPMSSERVSDSTASTSFVGAISDFVGQDILQPACTVEIDPSEQSRVVHQPLHPHFSSCNAADLGGAGDTDSNYTTRTTHPQSIDEFRRSSHVEAVELGNSRVLEVNGNNKGDRSPQQTITNISPGIVTSRGIESFEGSCALKQKSNKNKTSNNPKEQQPHTGQSQMTSEIRSQSLGAADDYNDSTGGHGEVSRQYTNLQVDPVSAQSGHGLNDSGRLCMFRQSAGLPGWSAFSREPSTSHGCHQSSQGGEFKVSLNIGAEKWKSVTALHAEGAGNSRKSTEVAKDISSSEVNTVLSNERNKARSISSSSPRKGSKAGAKARSSGKSKHLLDSLKRTTKSGQNAAVPGQQTQYQEPFPNGHDWGSGENTGSNVNDVVSDCVSMPGKGTSKVKHDNSQTSNSSNRAEDVYHKSSKLEEIASQLRRQSHSEEIQSLDRTGQAEDAPRELNNADIRSANSETEILSIASSNLQQNKSDRSHLNPSTYFAATSTSAADVSAEQVLEGDTELIFSSSLSGGFDIPVLTVETAKVLCDTVPAINQGDVAIPITKLLNTRSRCSSQNSICIDPTSEVVPHSETVNEAAVNSASSPGCDGINNELPVSIKTPEATQASFPMRVGESMRENSSPNWMNQFCSRIQKTINPAYACPEEVGPQGSSPGVLPPISPRKTMHHGSITPSPGSRSDQSFNSSGLANGSHSVSESPGCNPHSSRHPAFQHIPPVSQSKDYSMPMASPSWAGPGYPGYPSFSPCPGNTSSHLNQNGRLPSYASQSWQSNSEQMLRHHSGNKERQVGEKHAKSKPSKKNTQGKHAKKIVNKVGHPSSWPASGDQNYSITTQKYSFTSPSSWRHSPSPLTSSSSNKPRPHSASHHQQGTRSLPQTPSELTPQAASPADVDRSPMISPHPAHHEQLTSPHSSGYRVPDVPVSAASSFDIHFPSSLRKTYRAMHNLNPHNPIRMYDDTIEEGTSPSSMAITPHWELNANSTVNHEKSSRQPNKAVSIVSPVQTAENGYPGKSLPRQLDVHPCQSNSSRSMTHLSRSMSGPSRPSTVNPQAPRGPANSVSALPSEVPFWNQHPNQRPTSIPLGSSTHAASDLNSDPRAAEQEILYFRNQYDRQNVNLTEDTSAHSRRSHSMAQQEALTPADAARNNNDLFSLQEHNDDVFSPAGSEREMWYSNHPLPANQERGSEGCTPVPSSRGRDLPANSHEGRMGTAHGNGRLPHFGRSHSLHGTSVSSEDMGSGDSPDSGHVTPERQRQQSFSDTHVLQYSGGCVPAFAPNRASSSGGGKKNASKHPAHPSVQPPGGPMVSSGSSRSSVPNMSSTGSNKGHIRNPSFPGAHHSVNAPVSSQRAPLVSSSSSAVTVRQSASSTPQPPLIFHQFYRSSTSSTTRFSQTFHQHSHEMPIPPRPSSREQQMPFHNPQNDNDLMSMSRPELEQFRYYLMEYLKHSSALLQRVEERLTVVAGGVCPAPLTRQEIGQRLMALTMEPDCAFLEHDQSYRQKFGYNSSDGALDDLIIGGTPENPVINPKYDIYGRDVRREVSS